MSALTISQFRSAADNLARFASTRENAKPPEDRILIQSINDGLKFVAGTDDRTLIFVTGDLTQPEGRALVSARMFLTAAKALRGKGTLSFEFDGNGGATISTSLGGKVRLPAIDGSIPKWVRGSADLAILAEYDESFLTSLVRYVESSTGVETHVLVSTVPTNPNLMRVQYTDNYSYCVIDLPVAARSIDEFRVTGIPVDFIKSCRGLGSGWLMLKPRGEVEFGSNAGTAVTVGYHVAGALPEGPRFQQEPKSIVRVDRKALLEALKTMGNEPEYGRATISASPEGLSVSQYSGDVGMYGMAAALEGPAFKATVTADKLYRLVKAGQGKSVTIGYLPGTLKLYEDNGWRVYLASVV